MVRLLGTQTGAILGTSVRWPICFAQPKIFPASRCTQLFRKVHGIDCALSCVQ